MAKIQYVEVDGVDDFSDDYEPTPRVVAMTKRSKNEDGQVQNTRPKSKKPQRRDRTDVQTWADNQPQIVVPRPFVQRNYR